MRNFKQPGTWLGIIAIVLAMGGSAFAASKITGAQIKDGTITARDIKGHSLDAKTLSFSPITRVVTIDSQTVHLAPGQSTVDVAGVGNFKATCPSGTTVIGTGFDAGIGRVADVISYDYFVGGFMYNDTSVPYDVSLQAVCGGGRGAVAVAASVDAAQVQAQARYARAQRALHSVPVAHAACTRARIGGKSKCIARGQFCAVRYQRDYRRYGFTCKLVNGYYRLK